LLRLYLSDLLNLDGLMVEGIYYTLNFVFLLLTPIFVIWLIIAAITNASRKTN
jgi:hypothetical protein